MAEEKDTDTAVLDKEPTEPKEEEKPAEPTKEEEPEKKHYPAEGSKRWNEIWHENQQLKQRDVDREKDIGEIKQSYQELSNAVNRVEDGQFSDSRKPDIETNPEEYADFMYQKGKHEARKETKVNSPEKKVVTQDTQVKTFDIEEKTMRTIHDNYDEIMSEVNADIANDSVLRNQIYNNINPPKEAYKYGMEKRKRAAQDRQNIQDQGYAESGTTRYSGNDNAEITQLTDRQKSIAKNLGISGGDGEKQMIKNLNFQNKRIGRSK